MGSIYGKKQWSKISCYCPFDTIFNHTQHTQIPMRNITAHVTGWMGLAVQWHLMSVTFLTHTSSHLKITI